MTNAEKAGFEAYPENISYSTIGDVMYDYNAEKRRVYVAGYEQGYKETVDKTAEFLKYYIGKKYNFFRDEDIEAYKKAMEEQ